MSEYYGFQGEEHKTLDFQSVTTMSNKKPISQWITMTIPCLIATIITLRIMMIEMRKRRDCNVKFTTKWLKYSSMICIVNGFLTNLFFIIHVLPVFCHFCLILSHIAFVSGLTFMGFYQLSRLHYCFSNEQIHSNKGYPKWVFILMVIIGVLLMIDYITHLAVEWSIIYSKCGLNSKFEYYFVPVYTSNISYDWIWLVITVCCYLLWDIATLMLYYYKTISFKSIIMARNEIIYKRVLTILCKIYILTMLYEVMTIFVAIMGSVIRVLTDFDEWFATISNVVSINLMSISVNVSMFLMMDHNKMEYVKFLKIINAMRLNWICCAYGDYIEKQISGLLDNAEERNTDVDMTVISGQDHSLPEQQRPRQLSPVTFTNE